jgi:hypothetical protein
MREEFERVFLEIQKKNNNNNEILLGMLIEWLLEQCKRRTEKQFTLHPKGIRQYLESKEISFPHNKIVKRKVKSLAMKEAKHHMVEMESSTTDTNTIEFILCSEVDGKILLEIPNPNYVSSKEFKSTMHRNDLLEKVKKLEIKLEEAIKKAK